MCSYIYTIVYMACIVVGGILNIVAVVTPDSIKTSNNTLPEIVWGSWSVFGKCIIDPNSSLCKTIFEHGATWQQVTFICLMASICFCALGLIWSIISIIGCCCAKCLRPPLIVFAGMACATVTAALIAWGINMPSNVIGYSMICAIAAAFLLLLDTAIGFAVFYFSKSKTVELERYEV